MFDDNQPRGIRKAVNGKMTAVLPGTQNVMCPDTMSDRELDRYAAERSGPVVTYKLEVV
jgi:hypothetical protein